MTAGKTIALTRQTFVGKVMSLLFRLLSRLVLAFLPRSKRLLISWLQSPFAVILEAPKIKSLNCFHCFPIHLPWCDGTRCHDLRILEWVAVPFSNGSFQPRDQTQVSHIAGRFFTRWAIGNPRGYIGGKHLLLRSVNPDSFSLSFTNKGSEWP